MLSMLIVLSVGIMDLWLCGSMVLVKATTINSLNHLKQILNALTPR
jgi:hypothetical protein